MLKTRIKKEIDNYCNNVAIFCDYDNLYYGLTDYGLNITNTQYDIFYFINEFYEKRKIRTIKAFADFEQICFNDKNELYLLKHLQNNRVETYNVFGNNPKQECYRKNASDIELSLSAIETYYKESEIDTFVFISSDSDFIPIMNKLMFYGKQVHLYYMNNRANENILKFCNFSIDLIELMNINIERKNPEYWISTIKDILNNYYLNNNYENNIMSHKWLLENIQKKTYMSINTSNKLINKMVELNVIEKAEYNNFYGYRLKEMKFF